MELPVQGTFPNGFYTRNHHKSNDRRPPNQSVPHSSQFHRDEWAFGDPGKHNSHPVGEIQLSTKTGLCSLVNPLPTQVRLSTALEDATHSNDPRQWKGNMEH